MATYRELLEDEKWQGKRKTILSRDLFRCQNCLNEKYLGELFSSVAHFSRATNEYLFFDLEELPSEQKSYILVEKQVDFKYKEFFGYFQKIENDNYKVIAARVATNIDRKRRDVDVYLNAIKERPNEETLAKAIALYLKLTESDIINRQKPNFRNYKWIFVKGIHVHHKYYQLSKLPWEYPDEALVSLCWICHENLHANQKVLVYDENMNVVNKYTPCQRCFGAGWIPEFKHFHAGVCFRCGGAKYEELIT